MRIHVLVAALLLAGCMHHAGHHGGGAHADLDGEWVLVTDAARPPTIAFANDGASGFAGCNRWFAQVSRADAALRFSGVGATRMACPDPDMAVEGHFLNVLEHTRAARREGDTLILLGEDGGELARLVRAR